MNFIGIVDIILILAAIYLFFVREYLYARKQFRCLRCGDCCRLRVRISPEDEDKLKKAGHLGFLDKKRFLNRTNGHCILLGVKNGIAECGIEKVKPEICRNFPEKKGLFGKRRDYRCRSCWTKKK